MLRRVFAVPPSPGHTRCCAYFIWLGWQDWRAERVCEARSRTGAASARELARTALGAFGLVAALAAAVALAAPALARLAAQSQAFSLARASAAALAAAVGALAAAQAVRAAYFVAALCERGRRVHRARHAEASGR